MNDTELINQLKTLQEIKPNQDWVVSVKTQILGQEAKQGIVLGNLVPRMFFQFKPVFVSAMALVVLIGLFGFSQNSLPGDVLYGFKKAGEKGEATFFVSEQDLPQYKLEMANKRLEELSRIAKVNQVKKLAPAISAFQANITEAANNLVKAKDLNMKEVVAEAKKIEENKKKVESLGIMVGEIKQLDDAMKQLVEREMKALEDRILSEAQEEILTEVKDSYELGLYSQALEKILLLSYSE